MSYQNLTGQEQRVFKDIIGDLHDLFELDLIFPEGVDDVVDGLKSEEVKDYLRHLRTGSKPEVALREAFLAGKAILTKYLFGRLDPEVNVGAGFIDYKIATDPNRFVVLELKSLFEAERQEPKRIRQDKLRPERHKEQIIKYIREGAEFVVLTNLREWFLYNDTVT